MRLNSSFLKRIARPNSCYLPLHPVIPNVFFAQYHKFASLHPLPPNAPEIKPPSSKSNDIESIAQLPLLRTLPISCPGCGAFTQSEHSDEPGYYNTKRKIVRVYLFGDQILYPKNFVPYYKTPPKHPTAGSEGPSPSNPRDEPEIPYCDRCNTLVNQHRGAPIIHPQVSSINEMLEESPHKRNHVYHVLDAADFPMSLIPNLHERLSFGHVRTRNRRAKHHHFSRGSETDMSFIITRSDLLAPKKEQVDSLLPKLQNILRKAMGEFGQKARLHVHCVSAHRGWWTKNIKEEIAQRGGGQWLVGKVNVGKSGLLNTVFPKNLMRQTKSETSVTTIEEFQDRQQDDQETHNVSSQSTFPHSFSLLPPSQPAYRYPTMPVVSSVPGTTASPIRIPFGSQKGEVIDLPGINRKDLSPFVVEGERNTLIMESRIKPLKIAIKPGSSLLLGGLVRITPTTPDQIVMAHVFVTLKPHLTNTQKAIDIQTGLISSETIPVIATLEAQQSMALAGSYSIDTDITKKYAGPLTNKTDVKLKPDQLPFTIFGTDILISGCGWIELTAQVRRKKTLDSLQLLEQAAGQKISFTYPQVEVWSPEGKGIGQRECIEGWSLNKSFSQR